MSKTIEIGLETFATKKLATERCREILYRYRPGQEVASSDAVFLRDLIERHPRASQKIGVGIARFGIVDTKHGGQCFALVRVDGSWTDFSFTNCITPKSAIQEFKLAARRTVRDQVLNFRRDAFTNTVSIVCPIENVATTIKDCHVDHSPPDTFDVLIQRFIDEHKIDIAAVSISGFEDGAMEKSFADRALAAEWSAFHAKCARLRIVSVEANLSTLRKGAR